MGRITLKRKYTSNHPAKRVNANARVRNQVIEFVARKGKVTLSELQNFLKDIAASEKAAKNWLRTKKGLFKIEEDEVTLSTKGSKIYKSVMSLNEMNESEFLSFEEFAAGLDDSEKAVEDDDEDDEDFDTEEEEEEKSKKKKKDDASDDKDKVDESRFPKMKRVTKVMWSKFSDDEKEQALFTAVKDPDDVDKYFDMKWDQLPDEVTSNMFIESVSEAKLVPISKVKKGQSYLATDAGYAADDMETVKILKVKKDSSGEYDVEVELEDGSKDSWYLSADDKVFFKESNDFISEKFVVYTGGGLKKTKKGIAKNKKEAQKMIDDLMAGDVESAGWMTQKEWDKMDKMFKAESVTESFDLLSESVSHEEDLQILEARVGISEEIDMPDSLQEASNVMFDAFVKFRQVLEANEATEEQIAEYRKIRKNFEQFEDSLGGGTGTL